MIVHVQRLHLRPQTKRYDKNSKQAANQQPTHWNGNCACATAREIMVLSRKIETHQHFGLHVNSIPITSSCHQSRYFMRKSRSECRAPMSWPIFIGSILSFQPCLSFTSCVSMSQQDQLGVVGPLLCCVVHETYVIHRGILLPEVSTRDVDVHIVGAEINKSHRISIAVPKTPELAEPSCQRC